MKDSKNIVIGMLCAVICVMAVAYAAFSTTLNVSTTATVASNWCVQIKEASCPESSIKTQGAAGSVTANVTPSNDGLSATVSMSFTQPGDEASCTITYENCGSLDAVVTHTAQKKIGTGEYVDLPIEETGVATFNTANNGIEFAASGLVQNAPLTKNGGQMQITVVGKYLNVESGQETPEVKEAKIKIMSTAQQAA